jgi:hypothetical protein
MQKGGIMTEKTLGKVRDVAKLIVDISPFYYSEELLGLIPEDLLDKALVDDNLCDISIEIDQIRFQKQNELLNMSDIDILLFGSEIPESAWKKLVSSVNNKKKFQ